MHDLKQSEYICEEFGISAICKIFKAATENCEFYNFSYAKKKNLKTLLMP